jgi:ketol-acid reductoisomerase
MIDQIEEAKMRVMNKSSLTPLRGKKIAIIGYGAQGRAQALNLRDMGYRPTVGLPARSRSRLIALRDGLHVTTTEIAVREADVIFVLAPDHLHGTLYVTTIAPQLRSGQMLVFAHASSVHFGLVRPRRDIDVVLIAPLGPGKQLRDLRGRRDGVACFFAVHRNATGRAREMGLALAKAVGCIPAGAIETTFAEEAVGDLFGEQAVLCGGLAALLQAGVDTLVRHGAKPENAYLECVYQLDLIVDLIKSDGLRGMFAQISPTAAYGAVAAGPKIISPGVRRAMDAIYKDIAGGRFLKRWIAASTRSPRAMRPKLSPPFARGESTVLKALSPSRSRAN